MFGRRGRRRLRRSPLAQRRRAWAEDDVHAGVRHLDDVFGGLLGAVEELEEVLQLAGVLIFNEPLRAARRLRAPAEHRLVSSEVVLLPGDEGLPGLVDEVLVQQAVDDVGVQPVDLGEAGLEVHGDVVDVLLELAVQGGAEAAAPGPPLPQVLDDGLGVRARLAPVGGLVVLVERVGAPEALVAVRARVLSRSLVELLLVPLPVELPLEGLVTGRAPELCFRRQGCRR